MKYLLASVLVSFSFISGCLSEPSFKLGNEHKVTLSGETEYQDPVSGAVLIFEEGADGELITASIVSGPKAPFTGGQGWYVEYTGSGVVRARVEVGPGEEGLMYGYGIMPGAVDDGVKAMARWVPVPGDKLDGAFEYELPLPPLEDSKTGAQSRRMNHPGFDHFWLNRREPSFSDVEKRVMVRQQFWLDVSRFIDALPEALRTVARQEVDGRLEPRFYEDGNYYIGFTRRRVVGNRTTPMVGLKLDVDADVIAHEIGHYMNHVLAGDERYLILENTAPDENHGIGVLHEGRSTVMEDYAYFTQFFLRGGVGSADPTLPRSILAGISPANVDFPAVEGFGCVLMASLVRQNATVVAQSSVKDESVPVVAAGFGDVLALMASGAADINELRDEIERFLVARGEADKLPAMAERIGWSYFAKGRILDQDGDPLVDAEVRAISRVGSREYETGQAPRTDSNGNFKISRVFPGNSLLKVRQGNEEHEIAIRIDWIEPTNKEVDLGDLYTGQADLDEYIYCAIDFQAGRFNFSSEYDMSNNWVSIRSREGKWNGGRFSSEYQSWTGDGGQDSGSMNIVVDLPTMRVTSGSGDYLDGWCFRDEFESGACRDDDYYTYYDISIGELPIIAQDARRIVFGVEGEDSCEQVNKLTFRGENPFYNLTGYDCDSSSSLKVSCTR